MKWIGTKNLGMLLLAVWLIPDGLLPTGSMNIGQLLDILAIAAGVLILIGR